MYLLDAAFSYSHSQIDDVVKYIMNQEKHHCKKTFHEEYLELLEKFNVSYNTKYILKDIIYIYPPIFDMI